MWGYFGSLDLGLGTGLIFLGCNCYWNGLTFVDEDVLDSMGDGKINNNLIEIGLVDNNESTLIID